MAENKIGPNKMVVFPQKEGAHEKAPTLWGYVRVNLKELGEKVRAGEVELDEAGCVDMKVALWGYNDDGRKKWSGNIQLPQTANSGEPSSDLPETPHTEGASETITVSAEPAAEEENDLPF
jgi:hypothetical protein